MENLFVNLGTQDTVISERLEDLNLASEIVAIYRNATSVLSSAMANEAKYSEQAQAVNSCTSALGQLVKLQKDVYSVERMKKLEICLVKTLEDCGPELKEKFLKIYEAMLDESDIQ